jgi:lysophospholipase L1-like esterase
MVSIPPSRRRRVLYSVGAVALGLLAALLILEGAFRLFLWRHAEYVDRLREHVSREWGGELTLFDIVRASPSRDRVYELIPGARGEFAGAPLSVNAAGFRDRDRQAVPAAGTRRIAVLGDSIAFGWGVRADQRFTDRLETILNEDAAGTATRTEVLNFAVPGYNSVMELATLRDAVLPSRPDALVLALVNNDDELPNFIRLEPEVWSMRRSFIVEAAKDRMVGRPLGDTSRLARGGVVETGGRGHGDRVRGFRPELVPSEYRHLMGMDNARRALREIAAEAKSRGIPAVAVMHYPKLDALEADTTASLAHNYNTDWIQAAREAGFTICDPLPALLDHLRTTGAGERSLWVGGNDFHPNATAHRILAAELARTLRGLAAPVQDRR